MAVMKPHLAKQDLSMYQSSGHRRHHNSDHLHRRAVSRCEHDEVFSSADGTFNHGGRGTGYQVVGIHGESSSGSLCTMAIWQCWKCYRQRLLVLEF